MGNVSGGQPAAPAGISPEVQAKVDSLQQQFSQLQGRAQLAEIQQAMSTIEERLTEYPAELRALERRGFIHGRSLQERLQMLKGQWRKNRPRLEGSLKERQNQLKANLTSTSRLVTRARSGQQAAVASAESAIEALRRETDAADRALRSQYDSVDTELYDIGAQLSRIAWMMEALDESPDIQLQNGEGPLLAVETEWHRDGDEGPKGVLFLTNQRLLFEQKEEIVTKRRLGIFKAESEVIHKLWLDIKVTDIESVQDSEEGGFLGVGKADILELTCSGQAPVSRARFHLKGQDSADWRAEIKRVQSGQVTADRVQRSAAKPASVSLSFPSQCPNCTAALPKAERGATQIVCEFCGSAISPV